MAIPELCNRKDSCLHESQRGWFVKWKLKSQSLAIGADTYMGISLEAPARRVMVWQIYTPCVRAIYTASRKAFHLIRTSRAVLYINESARLTCIDLGTQIWCRISASRSLFCSAEVITQCVQRSPFILETHILLDRDLTSRVRLNTDGTDRHSVSCGKGKSNNHEYDRTPWG